MNMPWNCAEWGANILITLNPSRQCDVTSPVGIKVLLPREAIGRIKSPSKGQRLPIASTVLAQADGGKAEQG